MPSNLPSSFASAAAGQNANRDPRATRGDGKGTAGPDWSRRDGRSANGTLTLRRPSTTPVGQASQSTSAPDNAVQPPALETIASQQMHHESVHLRYTKDELLQVFRSQKPVDTSSRLFISGWDPSHMNGGGARGWGKANDAIPQDSGACWDHTGQTAPIGLQEMSAEEKEAFSTDINSPMKPPPQNKEAHQANGNGRKASLSQTSGNAFGVISPSSTTRPATRRRETADSNPFSGAVASPTGPGRFSRDESSPRNQRKGNEIRESEPDDGEAEASSREVPGRLPYANLRSNTASNAPISAMWPSTNPTTPGGGGFGNFALPSTSAIGDKRIGGGAPGFGGSRLAHLIPKDAGGDGTGKGHDGQSVSAQQLWRSRPRTDTDPFGDDELSGSAVLGGAQDNGSGDQIQSGRVGILGTPARGSANDFGMSGLTLLEQSGDNGPISPSQPYPYHSPLVDVHDQGHAERSNGDMSLGIAFNDPPSNFGSISRGFAAPAFDGSDRSQTSSVGAKGYALGSLSGWPASAGPTAGTPDRDRPGFSTAFGSSVFSPLGDLHSPSLSGLVGNVFGTTGSGLGTASAGRGSKLGSLFPPAMQAQMQNQEQDQATANDGLQAHTLGPIGRATMPSGVQDAGSPLRPSRGVFEDLFPSNDAGRSQTSYSTPDNQQQGGSGGLQSFTPVTGGISFAGVQNGPEPTQAQVRQMVMPDRMRWVYLDPQGQIQGPFTGLEMNDWYKANFFTPDLRVKKLEDREFEPLGQLIRRIGNSREPFLVPQNGIAHGPAPQGGPFSPSTGGGVVPPLSGVFPSFGRTLTAEEQNNLERRKQEEQYLMAQQRDFIMRQQAITKYPLQGPGLQHHSSAQSLQSQPSFSSITSPIGAPPQLPPIGAATPQQGGFPEHQVGGSRNIGAAEHFRLDEIPGLSVADQEALASFHASESDMLENQHHAADAGFRSNLPPTEELSEDQDGFRGRLKEFEELRAQHEAGQTELVEEEKANEAAMAAAAAAAALVGSGAQRPAKQSRPKKRGSEDGNLSLTQQVQKAQAAAAASIAPVDQVLPMPFPPPASTTPLPAPTAQRARSNLPDQYSRSQNGTPDNAQPPPLAPWAKEPGQEGQRGPGLKEIQEAEARKAAKAEEAATAMRKATMEQETALLREKEKQIAAAGGLPATSTWGHGSPSSAASPWTKPGAPKPTPTGPAVPSLSNSKKTLAEIQQEEEFRKQKAKDVAAAQSGPQPSVSKSYANLAGKPGAAAAIGASQTAQSVGSGWATVGAGGKIKAPTAPAAGQVTRSLSSSNAKSPIATGPSTRPLSIKSSAGVVLGKSENSNLAMEEFSKWVQRELSRGITSDISSFQATLDVLPLDTSIIADAVYASSTTMDGRHFATEYVRRKKLAEKGVVEKQPSVDASKTTGAGGGGWSEVAKRSGSSSQPPKDNDNGTIQGSGFKVVPSRKKGKK